MLKHQRNTNNIGIGFYLMRASRATSSQGIQDEPGAKSVNWVS